MCGITGIICQNNVNVPEELVKKANQIVLRRGPDGEGIFLDQNLALGHRRLAVIDLSDKGHQPMAYHDLVITYNGEIYNYKELRQELQHHGYQFLSETDTEVILAAYDYWGPECVQHFNGMWAFAIYNPQEKLLFCSRDRFGIKPFYYTQIGPYFCFGSEIKQFTTIPGWTAKLNKIRAYEFLVLGYHDHTNETLFQDVFQLPKGHSLTYHLEKHSFKINSYYQVPSDIDNTLSFEEAQEQFSHLLADAVSLRLRSDVKVGSALSGGLDSSSIVGMINQQLSKGQLETVSACFSGKAFDERPWIDAVAQKHQLVSHRVYPQFNDWMNDLKAITWHQDEPIVGAGVHAQWAVFQRAKESGITVMLDGQGADEILAGYNKFYYPFLKSLLKSNPLNFVQELRQYFQLHNVNPLQAASATWAFLKKRQISKPDWLAESFQPNPSELFQRSPDNSVFNTSRNLIYEMGLSILLHYEDRNSMAASVESRLPFLDYRLVEFCLTLPDHFKIKNAKRKYLLREAMKPLLPDSVYRRYDKMGYSTPQFLWMQENPEIFEKQLKNTFDRCPIFTKELLQVKNPATILRVIGFNAWVEVFGVECAE